ncbi:MAG: GNAT family N-acetyltransferase [Pseudomonadota bacterium]|nr:GNAT family N-acetyltransferase [Pseudomonadota bacterium]
MGETCGHGDRGDAVLRPLAAGELPLYLDHLARLDSASRRLRFGCAMDMAALQHHCLGLAGIKATVIGAFLSDTLRGAAELAPARAPFKGFEAAFSVESEYRRDGLCFALLTSAARLVSPGVLTLVCDAENAPMLGCAEKAGAIIAIDDDTAICSLRDAASAAGAPLPGSVPHLGSALLRGYV